MLVIITTMIICLHKCCALLWIVFFIAVQLSPQVVSMAIIFAFSFVLATVIEFVGNMEFLNFLTPFRYFFARML